MPKSEKMRQASRERILGTAMALFVERGYHGTTTRDITESAGISKGLMYNYFPSKEAILAAIIELRTQSIASVIAQCKVEGRVGATIGRVIEAYGHMLRRDRAYLRFRTALVLQPGIPAEVTDLIGARVAELFAAIESLLREVGHPRPTEQVYVLMAELEGMGLHYMGVLADYPLDEMQKRLIQKYETEFL